MDIKENRAKFKSEETLIAGFKRLSDRGFERLPVDLSFVIVGKVSHDDKMWFEIQDQSSGRRWFVHNSLVEVVWE